MPSSAAYAGVDVEPCLRLPELTRALHASGVAQPTGARARSRAVLRSPEIERGTLAEVAWCHSSEQRQRDAQVASSMRRSRTVDLRFGVLHRFKARSPLNHRREREMLRTEGFVLQRSAAASVAYPSALAHLSLLAVDDGATKRRPCAVGFDNSQRRAR